MRTAQALNLESGIFDRPMIGKARGLLERFAGAA
jgi:hypothetical protein